MYCKILLHEIINVNSLLRDENIIRLIIIIGYMMPSRFHNCTIGIFSAGEVDDMGLKRECWTIFFFLFLKES